MALHDWPPLPLGGLVRGLVMVMVMLGLVRVMVMVELVRVSVSVRVMVGLVRS